MPRALYAPDLYIIQSDVTGAIKVGRSKDPHGRLKALQTGCPYRLRLILLAPGCGPQERHIHSLMQRHKIWSSPTVGEWFAYEALPELPDQLYELLPIPLMDEWWIRPRPSLGAVSFKTS